MNKTNCVYYNIQRRNVGQVGGARRSTDLCHVTTLCQLLFAEAELHRLILAIWKNKYLARSNFGDSVINSNITLYLIENLVKGFIFSEC